LVCRLTQLNVPNRIACYQEMRRVSNANCSVRDKGTLPISTAGTAGRCGVNVWRLYRARPVEKSDTRKDTQRLSATSSANHQIDSGAVIVVGDGVFCRSGQGAVLTNREDGATQTVTVFDGHRSGKLWRERAIRVRCWLMRWRAFWIDSGLKRNNGLPSSQTASGVRTPSLRNREPVS